MIIPRSSALDAYSRATVGIGPASARKRIDLNLTVISYLSGDPAVPAKRASVADNEMPLAKLDGPVACESKRYDPNLWYSDEGSDIKLAQAICLNECSQQITCLTGAYERNEPHGVFGGVTDVQRRINTGLEASFDPESAEQADYLTMKEHWNLGRTDTQIARIMGVTQNSVQKWRARRGLGPNGIRGRQESDAIADKERRVLYEQGLSDADIASVLGMSTQAIKRWRKRAELLPYGSVLIEDMG